MSGVICYGRTDVSQTEYQCHKLPRTSSDFVPGKWVVVDCSTHRSSSSEVVACQRYKQLNYMIELEIDIYHDNQTYLNAANVSATSFKDTVVFLPEFGEWIQAPGITLPDQTKNGREIVGEDDETEPTAVDQSGSLEDLLFLLNDDLGTVLPVGRDGMGVLPRSALVDLQELLGDVLDTTKGKSG